MKNLLYRFSYLRSMCCRGGEILLISISVFQNHVHFATWILYCWITILDRSDWWVSVSCHLIPVWSQDIHGHVYVGGYVISWAIQIFRSWEVFMELESSVAPCTKWAASLVTRVLVCVCLCTQSIHPFHDSIKNINSKILNDHFLRNSVWIWWCNRAPHHDCL